MEYVFVYLGFMANKKMHKTIPALISFRHTPPLLQFGWYHGRSSLRSGRGNGL
jgi:hypothetical protein